jgi:hypothetical protein
VGLLLVGQLTSRLGRLGLGHRARLVLLLGHAVARGGRRRLVAVGQHALEALAWEYTTRSAEDFDVEVEHATTIHGRGFEIVPMIEPAEQTDEQTDTIIDHLLDVLGRDYRQTKGRRGR